MRKYFGTDGIRGVANKTLTPELAFAVGKALAQTFQKANQSNEKLHVVIGKDTRISSDMLEASLISGLTSGGVDVYSLGVIPTPGVAYITQKHHYQCGIMISASHNPYPDNGIKIFGADGYKLTDEMELEIESYIENPALIDFSHITGENVGRVQTSDELSQEYVDFLVAHGKRLDGLHIALDCAHGATSRFAKHVFTSLGANVSVIGDTPDGININEHVGSTHPETLATFVQTTKSDFGFSFDGDGDRVISIDEQGEVRDGDYMLYLLSHALKSTNELKDDVVVATVMSNLGFYKALESEGFTIKTTAVGDRYVVEEMRNGNYSLGGEQSGHIILGELCTTGDGLLSAVVIASHVCEQKKALSELCDNMKKYPQLLENIHVASKTKVLENQELKAIIEQKEAELEGRGRILVRASGTEELVRVMAEAETDELCTKIVSEISAVVRTIG